MKNWQRYAASLAVGFLGGIISAAIAKEPYSEFFRHGLIGIAPAFLSLQMTLQTGETTPKAKGTSAGQ